MKGARRCSVRDLFKQKLEIVTANLFFFLTVSDHSSSSPSDLDEDDDSHSPTRCVIFIWKLEHGLKLTLLQKFIGHADSFVVLL